MTGLEVAQRFDTLRNRLLHFNERKQEWFCLVCRYRDPLYDGTKLHDDDCPLLRLYDAIDDLVKGR